MRTIALVLAGWTLVSLPLALVVGRLLAGSGRHHPPYVVRAGIREPRRSSHENDRTAC